jgi:hypothetical protein
MNLGAFLNQAADVAVQVTQHDPLSLPANLLDRVKLTALIDALNALDYALRHSEELQELDDDSHEERMWAQELKRDYAKEQVTIQMNINALKVNLQEVAA